LAGDLNALTREDALLSDGFDMVPVLFLGRRHIKTATSSLGDLGDATEMGRTCATGAPYCLPFAP
jgi:hypothetical protein